MEAVCNLVEANGKDQEGSFQMMFDHRDRELDQLEMEDLTCSREDLNEWVNVKMHEQSANKK